jgi:outer membrane protein assembly factor BamB
VTQADHIEVTQWDIVQDRSLWSAPALVSLHTTRPIRSHDLFLLTSEAGDSISAYQSDGAIAWTYQVASPSQWVVQTSGDIAVVQAGAQTVAISITDGRFLNTLPPAIAAFTGDQLFYIVSDVDQTPTLSAFETDTTQADPIWQVRAEKNQRIDLIGSTFLVMNDATGEVSMLRN